MHEAVFLTGGLGNLGKTVVAALADAGYELHLAVRSTAEIKQEPYRHYYQSELQEEGNVFRMLDEIAAGKLPIIAGVFMAGGYAPGEVVSTLLESVNEMISLNFATAFIPARKLLQIFKQQGSGKLIFIGAKAAMDPETAHRQTAYALSKQMLFGFCGMVNAAFSEEMISAHMILPGTIDTTANRMQMPHADTSSWSKPADIATAITNILKGSEQRTVIEI